MLLVWKLWPIQVVISLPLWIKLTMSQLLLQLLLLLFFLCNFSSFFSYVGGILVNKHFSLLLIDRYILATQQIMKHTRSICDTLFDMQRSSELPQKPWQPQSHFHWAVPQKSCHFSLFSSSSENINSTARVLRLSFRFLWLWFNISYSIFYVSIYDYIHL